MVLCSLLPGAFARHGVRGCFCFKEFGACFLAVVATEEFRSLDFALELHQAIEHGFGAWRATWHIHVDRDNFIYTLHHTVALLEWTTRHGATTTGNHILWLCHLLIEANQRWSHTIGDGALTHDVIALAG